MRPFDQCLEDKESINFCNNFPFLMQKLYLDLKSQSISKLEIKGFVYSNFNSEFYFIEPFHVVIVVPICDFHDKPEVANQLIVSFLEFLIL